MLMNFSKTSFQTHQLIATHQFLLKVMIITHIFHFEVIQNFDSMQVLILSDMFIF